MPASLESRAALFEADVTLVHLLLHGTGASIQTNAGPLRTFAQLQADLEAELNAGAASTAAGQSRLVAEQAATAAAADALTAQAARDAALLSNGMYPELADGQAGTAEGGYFSVPSPSSDEYLVLYRRTASGADEIKRYPSAAALLSAQANALIVQLAMACAMVSTQAALVEIRNDSAFGLL